MDVILVVLTSYFMHVPVNYCCRLTISVEDDVHRICCRKLFVGGLSWDTTQGNNYCCAYFYHH